MGYMQILWIKSCLTYLLDHKYRSFRLGTSSVVKKCLRSKYRMILQDDLMKVRKKWHAMIPNDSQNGYVIRLIRDLSQYDQPNIDRYEKVLLNYTNVINYGSTLPYDRERQCSMSWNASVMWLTPMFYYIMLVFWKPVCPGPKLFWKIKSLNCHSSSPKTKPTFSWIDNLRFAMWPSAGLM